MTFEGLSAVTLTVSDMARSVRFYSLLGFELLYGGEDARFTSFKAGSSFLNLDLDPSFGTDRVGRVDEQRQQDLSHVVQRTPRTDGNA